MSELKLKVPGFAYPGGKVRLRKWLVSRMPLSGRWYLEPFAGRGNVFWYASQFLGFERWWLNDPWTARWFEVLRDFDLSKIPQKISREEGLDFSRRAFKQRDTDDLAVLLESRCQFSGGISGSSTGMIDIFKGSLFVKEVLRVRHILRKTMAVITAKDFADICFDQLDDNDFVYLDPPYLKNKVGYAYDNIEHETLLKIIKTFGFPWMISGYDNELYWDMLGKPTSRKRMQLHVRVNPKKTRSETKVECIWTNYVIGSDGVARRKKVIRARKR